MSVTVSIHEILLGYNRNVAGSEKVACEQVTSTLKHEHEQPMSSRHSTLFQYFFNIYFIPLWFAFNAVTFRLPQT